VELGAVLAKVLHPALAGRGDQHEDVHLPFGNGKRNFLQSLLPCIQDHLVCQHPLHFRGLPGRGTEEHERADKRAADFLPHAGALNKGLLAGDIGLQGVLFQQLFDVEDLVVEYFQGEPVFGGMRFCLQWKNRDGRVEKKIYFSFLRLPYFPIRQGAAIRVNPAVPLMEIPARGPPLTTVGGIRNPRIRTVSK